MDKLQELREKYKNLTEEIRSLNDAGKVEEASKKLEERKLLQKQIDVAVALAEEEKRDLEAQKKKQQQEGRAKGSGNNKELVDEVRSFTKAVLHEEMSEEERAVVKTTDNAAVLPGQFINTLEAYRDGFAPLKEDCDVIKVTTKTGSKATYNADQNGKFKDIAEGDAIEDGTMVTNSIEFSVKKVGIKVPLSSELVDDAEVEIETAVNDTFAESSVMTENYNIIKVLNDNATAVAGVTDYTSIYKAVTSQKPSVRKGVKIYLNEAAYTDLANMKDKNGNDMNLIKQGANGEEYYKNVPIREFDSTFVTPTEGKTCVVFVANPREAVKFFDRTNGTTADKWYDHDNQIKKLAVTERLDIKKGNVRSIKKIEY